MKHTLKELLDLCSVLQSKGVNVSFSSSHNSYEVEHRDNESCELIVGFRFRDSENPFVINAIYAYLSDLETRYVKSGGQ